MSARYPLADDFFVTLNVENPHQRCRCQTVLTANCQSPTIRRKRCRYILAAKSGKVSTFRPSSTCQRLRWHFSYSEILSSYTDKIFQSGEMALATTFGLAYRGEYCSLTRRCRSVSANGNRKRAGHAWAQGSQETMPH